MKHTLFLLAAMAIAAYSHAQTDEDKFELSKSSPYTVVDAYSKLYFAIDANTSIAVKTHKNTVVIQKFDVSTMKVVKTKTYEDMAKGTYMQDVIQLGDKLFFIYAEFDKKSKRYNIYHRQIIAETCVLKRPVPMFTTSRKAVSDIGWNISYPAIPLSSIKGGQVLLSSFSEDGSKVMFQYRLYPESRNDAINYDVIGFQVFDNTMTKIWGKEQKMPYTEKQMNNLAYTVSNSGEASMLAYLNEKKAMELFKISNVAFEKYSIELGSEIKAELLMFHEYANGDFTCTGYFSEAEGSGNATGILHLRFNAVGEVLGLYTHEFPMELIKQFESAKSQKKAEKNVAKGKPGIPNLKLKYTYVAEDESVLLQGEQSYSVTRRQGNSTYTVYYRLDAVVAKLNQDGSLAWLAKLPKSQRSGSPEGGMGLKHIPSNDKHYFLYVDHVENKDLKPGETPETHVDGQGGFLTAWEINNKTGEQDKIHILDLRNFKGKELFQFGTSRILDLDETHFLVEAYIKGKKDMMVLIELND